MHPQYAEQYALVGQQVDEHGLVLLDCLLKRNRFVSLDDVACVTIAPVGGAPYSVQLNVHHVPIVGIFKHVFGASGNDSYLYGVLDFRCVDEKGIATGEPLVRVPIDADGNCGWRNGFDGLHSTIPVSVQEGSFVRTGLLKFVRLRVLEMLEEKPIQVCEP